MLKANYLNISEDNLPESDEKWLLIKNLKTITMLDYICRVYKVNRNAQRQIKVF